MRKGTSAAWQVLGIVANKWTATVIRHLSEGSKRPSELMQLIEGVSQKMLTQTLRQLEQRGMVTRKVYAVVPPRVDYALTPLGQTLIEPIDSFRRWVKEHRAAIEAWERQQKTAVVGAPGAKKARTPGKRRS